MRSRNLIIAAAALLGTLMAHAAEPKRVPIEQLPSVKELPDPFLFKDGTRVQSPPDWARRRREIIETALLYEYGFPPPTPANVKAEVIASGPTTRPSEMPGATEQTIKLTPG